MRRFTCKFSWGLLFLVLARFPTVCAAEVEKIPFSVQLIRGSDSDKPDDPAWKPVEAKLDKNLRAVFRWRYYWEVKRESVSLLPDKVVRLHLTSEREVELKLLDPPNTQIRLFYKGELTRCSHQPIKDHICVLGGDQKSGESWFVVVSRVKPLESE
jgi:hypothetical protein